MIPSSTHTTALFLKNNVTLQTHIHKIKLIIQRHSTTNTTKIKQTKINQRSKQVHDRNTRMAMYAASAVIGALGATYASVPLYKLFCQATGFGGTTQRVRLSTEEESEMLKQYEIDLEYENPNNNTPSDEKSKSLTNILKRRLIRSLDQFYDTMNNLFVKTLSTSDSILPGSNSDRRRMANTHGNTWTDEVQLSKLSSLEPHPNGRLLRIHFDTSTSDILPWTFTPTQPYVKVVPGETALCFFTATNHSKYPITGVATYNVHPPKAGLYFNKIQCFCFEEQRLLPGETVDMPVFFYVDPDFMEDGNLDRCNHITLSYTFFRTDVEDDVDAMEKSIEELQQSLNQDDDLDEQENVQNKNIVA